jgi:hypothetical protein
MPWKCPACRLAIQHEAEIVPRPGVIYRCHICRLELVVDPSSETLVLAPMPGGDESPARTRKLDSAH